MDLADMIIATNAERKKKKDNKKETLADQIAEGSYIDTVAVNRRIDDLAPIRNVVKEQKEEDRTWLSKGAFDDGYQIGDITKTILGTTGDIGIGVGKGIFRIGEGVGDLISYGVAGVADIFGNDDYANRIRKEATVNETDEIFAPLDYLVDPVSVIGEKGDSISEGLGYVGAILATGGVAGTAGLGTAGTTAVTTGLTGFSSMGSGMSEAYQGGATDEEALKYGIIAGVAEAGSELIFGGLGKAVNAVGLSKGLSSLDDTLAKKISKKLTSTLSKNLAEYTVKAGAEGVEEVISGVTQAIGKKMTYMSDEDLVQIIKDENLLEQFIVGTVTSSIAQAPGLVKTTSEGKPFISDNTQDNQAKIQGLQQEITKKTEELNKSQDVREKQIIQETINGLNEELNELTNAQTITDEKELRKQNFTYQAQENDSDIKKAVYESASQVMNNTEKAHKFVDVVAKIAEERGTTYKFTNNEQLKQLGHIQEGMTTNGLVNENGEVLINIDSAKALNAVVGHETTHLLEGTEGNETEEYKALRKIAIEYAKSKGEYDTRYKQIERLYKGKNANIEKELTADIVGDYLFTDENFVRELSVKQPTIFEKIRNFISDLVVKFKGTDQEKQLRQLQRTFEKAYKAQGTQTSTDTKYSFLGEVITQDNPQAQMALDTAKEMYAEKKDMDYIRQNTGWFKASDGNWKAEVDDSNAELIKKPEQNKTYRLGDILTHDDLYSFIPEYKNIKVITTDMEAYGSFNPKTGLLKLNNNIINNKTLVESTILHELQHATQTVEGWKDGTNLKQAGSWEAYENNYGEREAREVQARRKMSFEDRMRKAPSTQSKVQYSLSDNKIQGLESYTDDDIKSLTNSYIQEKLEENGIYDVTIKDTAIHGSRGRGTARVDSDLDVVVEFEGDIREDDLFNILNEEPMYIDGIQVDINPITESLKDYMERSKAYDKEVLSKQSTTDNQGRTLTKRQQEYFKDSKVRDENGNLLTVYHGTNADFNVFKKGKKGYLGPGIYLAEERSQAERYTDYGIVKEVYVDIKNPLTVTSNIPDKEILNSIYGSDKVYNRRVAKDGLGNFLVNSRDLKKLQEMGYDGIAWKYPSGNEYMVLNSNQIKNVDNTNPTTDPDIRYSLSEDISKRYDEVKNQRDDLRRQLFELRQERNDIIDTIPNYRRFNHYHELEDIDKRIDDNVNLSKQLYAEQEEIETKIEEIKEQEKKERIAKEEAEATPFKLAQNRIIQETNPMLDDYHTGIRSVGDIRTWEEAMSDAEKSEDGYAWGDFTKEDAERALKNNSITIYSSYPIKNGVFVSTSYIQAEQYAGGKGGRVYSKTIKPERVAWINVDEGQYASVKPSDIKYSLSEDNQGNELKPNVQKWAENSKARDEDGNLKVLYHGTATGEFTVFDKSKASVEGDWGAGFYFTDSEYDVNTNYEDGGADFDNKVARLAEEIEQEEEISYEEAKEKAKEILYKGGHKFEVYLNIENPAIVGETYLFNNEDYYDNYNMEDFDSEEEYYEAIDQLVADDIDSAIWAIEREYDFWNGTDEIRNLLYESIYAGGIEVQELKNKLNELYLETDEGLVANDVARIILESLGYDGIIDPTVSTKWNMSMDSDTTHYIAFKPNQIKSITNENPTSNPDINLSLSAQNEEIAPTGQWNVRGEDVRLEIEEAIAPLQETISNLSEQLEAVLNSNEQVQETAPTQEIQPTQPTLEEVQNLIDIRDNKSGSEYARAFFALRDKYGQVELYKSLNEYYSTGTVTQPSNVENIDTAPVSQEVVEKQGQEAFNTLTDEQAPSWEDAIFETPEDIPFETGEDTGIKVESPLDSRDIDEVGNRKVKAYQYENPEVKPFFQAEAQNMLYDLDNTIKGERIATHDQEGYITGWAGITRQTTEAIAYLKDNYGYSYDQIRKGLNAIIEDDGKENNAVSKRIEFLLDERLREGYTTSDGIPIPANEDYINFLNEKQVTEYNKKAFNALTDEDIPMYEKTEPLQSPTTRENMISKQTTPMKVKTAQNGNTDVTGGKQRKWVKTSTESEVVNREILPDDLDQTKIFYQPITNKATLGTANVKLDTLGYEKAVEYFNNQVLNKTVKVEDIVLGERLIQEAIKNKDTKTAGELIQNVAILGTELGQKVQALSIIQRMTPEGQLKMIEKTINRGKAKGDQAFTDVNLTQEMKDKILKTYNEDGSYNQDELNKAVDEVKQQIADQMPSTMMDKINAWRYLSMLGNPKTHIRNIVSNVAMKGTVAVKNALARTVETIAPIENRTKTWKMASDDVINFAKQTTLEMKDVISGDSKYSESEDIKAKREIFKNKVLEKAANLNSDLLEKEDWWFSKGAFESSFREFLTANGIETQQDIQNNPELIEKGKNYAVEQAQIATFRQYSWLSNKIRDIENRNAATQIAVGAVLPFKKTPINIAKTGLSYSPLGFAKTLTYDIAQVKKGNMEASTLIDHLAQNTTGTALTLVGYMLAQAGFLNGAGDDDKEGKYDYQLGKQAYSINIGGSTYSLSWLSPVAMPLFVGANAYEQLVEGEEWNADVVLETLGQTLDPLSEMSFLSSLDSVLSSYDSGVQRFFGIGEAMAQNYVTQFVPTASSQLAATLDDTKRSTKVSGDSTMKVLEETYNKLIYKIPGLRETLEPTTDIWGNEIKQNENLFTRAFENFIAPYARKDSIATEIDEELKDLYGQTGDNGILPSIPYNYVNYDGEKYNMSAEEYTDYKKIYGQTANDLLEDLFRTTTYQRATSEERTDMVNDVYDYARDEAKLDYLAKEGVDYTNATEDKVEVYKENLIKGAVENDMTTKEYGLYLEDPEEYKFLMEKDYEYRRQYFDTYDSLKELDKSFDEQKEGINDDDELDALYTEKKAGIVDKIINSGLDDTEKASLYKRYYNSDTVDTVMKSAISIDDYLVYETKEFKADLNAKGNSIPGSRKEKVIDYVNTLNMNIGQKAILIKSTNTFKFNDYNVEIVRYLDSLGLQYDDFVSILNDLDMTVKGDMVYWD